MDGNWKLKKMLANRQTDHGEDFFPWCFEVREIICLEGRELAVAGAIKESHLAGINILYCHAIKA